MGILIWLGVGFLAFLLVWVIREDLWFLGRPCAWTKGTVIGYTKSRNDEGDGYFFFAKMRFETAPGQPVEFSETYGRSFEHMPIGTRLDVVYPADAPDRARVHRPIVRVIVYAFLIVGIALLIWIYTR